MNEQQALTRVVEAIERIAWALETMAKQQAEFLATMPAEDVIVPEDFVVEPFVATKAPLPTHPYDAACACLACWTERKLFKR